MAKYYFRKDDESCYSIDGHLKYMEENKIKEIEIFEAKRIKGTGYFFCKFYLENGEVGCCGKKYCKNYEPNNGKNGRCKNYGYVYEQKENKRILKLKTKQT